MKIKDLYWDVINNPFQIINENEGYWRFIGITKDFVYGLIFGRCEEPNYFIDGYSTNE